MNGVTLREHIPYEKSCQSYDLKGFLKGLRPFQRGTVGQRAAKLQAVKIGGLKKILPLGQSQTKPNVSSLGSTSGGFDHLQSVTYKDSQ